MRYQEALQQVLLLVIEQVAPLDSAVLLGLGVQRGLAQLLVVEQQLVVQPALAVLVELLAAEAVVDLVLGLQTE